MAGERRALGVGGGGEGWEKKGGGRRKVREEKGGKRCGCGKVERGNPASSTGRQSTSRMNISDVNLTPRLKNQDTSGLLLSRSAEKGKVLRENG